MSGFQKGAKLKELPEFFQIRAIRIASGREGRHRSAKKGAFKDSRKLCYRKNVYFVYFNFLPVFDGNLVLQHLTFAQ